MMTVLSSECSLCAVGVCSYWHGFSTGTTKKFLSLRLLLPPHGWDGQLCSVLARRWQFGVMVPLDVHGRGAMLGGRARRVGHLAVLLV